MGGTGGNRGTKRSHTEASLNSYSNANSQGEEASGPNSGQNSAIFEYNSEGQTLSQGTHESNSESNKEETPMNLSGRCLKIENTPIFKRDEIPLVSSSITQLLKDLDDLIKDGMDTLLPGNFSGRCPPPHLVKEFNLRLVDYYKRDPSNRKRIRQLIGTKLASDASEPYMTQIWINLNLHKISRDCGIEPIGPKRFGFPDTGDPEMADRNGTIVKIDKAGDFNPDEVSDEFLTKDSPVTQLLVMSVSNDTELPKLIMTTSLGVLAMYGNTLNTSTMVMDTVRVLGTVIDLTIKHLKKMRESEEYTEKDQVMDQTITFLESKQQIHFTLEEALHFLSQCNIRGEVFSNSNGTHKVVLYGGSQILDLTGPRSERLLYKLARKATKHYIKSISDIDISINGTQGKCKKKFKTSFAAQLLGMNMVVWMSSNPFDTLTDALFGSLNHAHDIKWIDPAFIEKLSWRKKFGIETGNIRMARAITVPNHALVYEQGETTYFSEVDDIYSLSAKYGTPNLQIKISHSEGSETLRPVTAYAACAQTSEQRLARASSKLLAMVGTPYYSILGCTMQTTSDRVVISRETYDTKRKGDILLKDLGIKNMKQLVALKNFFSSLEKSETLETMRRHPSIHQFMKVVTESQTLRFFTDSFIENIDVIKDILSFPRLIIAISEITSKIKHDSLVEHINQSIKHLKNEFSRRDLTKKELDEIDYAATYVESIPDSTPDSRSDSGSETVLVFGHPINLVNLYDTGEDLANEDSLVLTKEEEQFIKNEVSALEKTKEFVLEDEEKSINSSDKDTSSKEGSSKDSSGTDEVYPGSEELEMMLDTLQSSLDFAKRSKLDILKTMIPSIEIQMAEIRQSMVSANTYQDVEEEDEPDGTVNWKANVPGLTNNTLPNRPPTPSINRSTMENMD